MSNIDDDIYDPFPKTGKVKEYEPFIRQEVTAFCRKYPKVSRQYLLIEAVRLAAIAEARFKPELGYDFSTFLRHHLLGLHRFAQKEQKQSAHDIPSECLVRLEADVAEEINTRADTGRRFIPHSDSPAMPATSYAAPVGRQAGEPYGVNPLYLLQTYGTAEDRRRGIIMDLSADLLATLDSPASVLTGRMMAVIAYNERRQRETDQELENQRNGCYDPVFYEPRPFTDPAPILTPSTSTLIPARSTVENEFNELKRPEQRKLLQSALQGAADALQPSLSVIEGAILYWMIRPNGRTMTQVAADIGISKGYASKLQDKLEPQLRKGALRLILRNVGPK